MSIAPGIRLGPYLLGEQIGAGGMGEVYKATDTRLDRTVAIKVLPEVFAADPERRERFEREARAVSSLNHPHICTLYDVGEQGGAHFLVMELVEGQTLAERLHKGPLPLEQALEYAAQIADALDKAHRKGVVHRDLKPGNIMTTQSGVKLLDFGLAKLRSEKGAVSAMSQMPTQGSAPLTAAGTILGTLQYMAPEQLEGKETDARTDIFAFGAVVYEMVTGKKAFEGQSQASLIAAILEREPKSMRELQALTPKALDHVVERCLAKDPDERWQTASDLARELHWGVREPSDETKSSETRQRAGRGPWIWQAATFVLLVVAVALGAKLLTTGSNPRAIRTDILTPPSPTPVDFALSPDGTQIAYVAYDDDSVARVMLRRLDSDASTVQPLQGTENASVPFWAPDSRSIAFWSDGWIKTIELETKSIRQVVQTAPNGFSWNGDTILYVPVGGGLTSVSSEGKSDPVRLALGSHDFVIPGSFLPSGHRFLFYDTNERKIYAAELGGAESTIRELTETNGTAVFLPPATMLYVSQGTLYARDFDANSLQFGSAPAVVLATNIVTTFGDVAVSASDNGMIAYRTRPTTPPSRFVWVDRSGNTLGIAAEPKGVLAGSMNLTANDQYMVFEQDSVENGEIYLYSMDLGRPGALPVQLTSARMSSGQPKLSQDGAFLAFFQGNYDLMVTRFTGSENPAKNILPSVQAYPTDWSSDGKWLLYYSDGNLSALPMNIGEPAGNPVAAVSSNYDDSWGQFSPDGRWIAFESDRDGQHQIYLTAFPGGGPVISVTRNGGTQVRWNPNGKELFFITLDGKFSAATVQLPGGSNGTPEVGQPVALFAAPIGSLNFRGQQYDVSADGRRFLMNMPRNDNSAITLLQNWNRSTR